LNRLLSKDGDPAGSKKVSQGANPVCKGLSACLSDSDVTPAVTSAGLEGGLSPHDTVSLQATKRAARDGRHTRVG